MQVGVFAKTFAGRSLETALDGVAACGVRATQFNLSLLGGPSLPAHIPKAVAERVRAAIDDRGLDMVAVSGTYNMAHPDPRVRSQGLRSLESVIAAAASLGTRVVTLCTGTRDRDNMWCHHPDNATPSAWADMTVSIAAAVAVADTHDVTLGIEPEFNNVVADAAAARRLLDELSTSRLRIVLDAANLIRPGQLHRQRATLGEAFDLLAGDLVLAHAKDVLKNGTIVPAGRGGLNYAHYVSLLQDADFSGAVVLHDLSPHDVPASVAFLQQHLDRVTR